MIARKLALLFVILGFGAAVETAFTARTRFAMGPSGCRILTGKFHGPSYSFESALTKDTLPAALTVDVENAFGEVRIAAGVPGKVELKLRKVVYQPTEASAREFASRLDASLNLAGSTLRVTTNRRELERRDDDVGFETHLELVVPPATIVKVQNEHGRVDVEDVAEARIWNSHEAVRVSKSSGPVEVNSRHGAVDVRFVGGTLSLSARHGDVEIADVARRASVTVEHGDLTLARVADLELTLHHGDLRAEDLRGDFEMRGNHAGASALGVKGRAVIETSYRGVELKRVTGDVNVNVQHGGLKVEDVGGSLTAEVSHNGVEAHRIAGKVDARVSHGGFNGSDLRQGARVRTSGDDVVLSAFEGPIEVQVERGGVRLLPDKGLTAPVSVTSMGGGISLEVPPQSRFDLDARSERGEVRVDLPDLKLLESRRSRVTGSIGGGGNTVTLESRRGDVTVANRSAVAAKTGS